MTRNPLTDVSITSPGEFETVLAAAVETAIEANVDVRGAWEFETCGSTHNWEIEIVELAKEFDDE
ncbi:hypothetical protein [Halovivax asiaticus]|nr:hypothetical protein [Halovivax asiaticus]